MTGDLSVTRWNPIWISGALVSAMALVVMLGWFIQSPLLVQIHPGFAPMQFNTALCHFLCGLGIMLLSLHRTRAVRGLALIVMAVAGVTLLQYLAGWNSGLDQWFVRPFLMDRTPFPGRMAPNSALAFFLVGAALFVAGHLQARQRNGAFPAVLGMLVCLMAVAALLSYAFSVEPYFLWGKDLIGMAVHTAFLFLLVGAGLLFSQWRLPSAITRMHIRQLGRVILLYSLGMTLLTVAICAVLILAPLWGLFRTGSENDLLIFSLLAAMTAAWLGLAGLKSLLQPLMGRIVAQSEALEMQVAQTRDALKSLGEESEARLAAERAGRLNEARYRTMVEATQTAIWFTDGEGRITQPMPSWSRFTGQTWDEYQGLGGFSAIHPEDLPRVQQEWSDANQSGVFSSTYRLRNVDGTYHHVQSRGIALRNEQGQIQEWIGSVYDVQPMKDAEEKLLSLNAELENRVRIRTEQLTHSNRELEQFAYAASHDLKSPLRSIASFASLLRGRYEDSLPETARDFVELIRESALQGQSLVDDMLELSRVQLDQAPPRASVSMDRVLDSVLEELAPDIGGRGGTVHREPLPTVCGDAGQLARVMKNLVLNALIYQPRGQPQHRPQVWVGADRDGGSWRLRVRDNGIGIAPEDQNRLFNMFQRLHTQDQYPGNGIGLALCAKILRRHGGRIWVESQPSAGATFFMTLPDTAASALDTRDEKSHGATAR